MASLVPPSDSFGGSSGTPSKSGMRSAASAFIAHMSRMMAGSFQGGTRSEARICRVPMARSVSVSAASTSRKAWRRATSLSTATNQGKESARVPSKSKIISR